MNRSRSKSPSSGKAGKQCQQLNIEKSKTTSIKVRTISKERPRRDLHNSRDPRNPNQHSSSDNDDVEFTTTNVMPSTLLSLNSSVSEIGVDAWQELGEDDFSGSSSHHTKEETSNRSLYIGSNLSSKKVNVKNYAGPSCNLIEEEILESFHNNNNNLTIQDIQDIQEIKIQINDMVKSCSHDSKEPHLYYDQHYGAIENSDSFETIMSMDGEGSSTTSVVVSDPLDGDELDNLNSTSRFRATEESVIKQIIANDQNYKQQQSSSKNLKSTRMISNKINNNYNTNVGLLKKAKEYGNKYSKSVSKQGPSPTPPGKHRITIYDGPAQKQGGSIIPGETPLHCDFIQSDVNANKKQGGGYHQVFISDKEYRLLQEFLPSQQKKNCTIFESPKDECQQRTLFGWVSASSTSSSKPPSIVATPAEISRAEIPLEYQRSRSKRGNFASSTSCSFAEVGEGTDSDFLLNLTKTSSADHEVQTHTMSDIEWNMMQTYDSKQSSVTRLLPSQLLSNRTDLEQTAGNMRQSILNASETSVVLMNTIFKDIFTNPNISKSFEQNQQFQEFIQSKNEIEALEKASIIFASAAQHIHGYLDQLKEDSKSYKRNTSSSAEKAEASPNGESTKYAPSAFSSIYPTIWNSEVDLGGPKNFQLSITAKPGIILETIHCNNCEFSMIYSGGIERINLLESAVREKSEPIHLNPTRLLEMIDRNASFASGRIISSKYYMSLVANQFGSLVQKFISGKYSKPFPNKISWSRKLPSKLQGINTFSGIILQTSTAFFSVCKKIKAAIEKAMRLDDVLRIPRLPGLTTHNNSNNDGIFSKINITQEFGLPLGTKMPMKEAMVDLSYCVNEIDSILVTLKNSLDSLNQGVKVKSSYVKKIEYFFLAVKQLEFGHDIDFGTVIMSLACNAALIQSLSNLLPNTDVEMRSRILANLGHLNWGSGELVKLVKKVCLLSSFVATKSIGRLRKMIIMKRQKRLRKGKSWFVSTSEHRKKRESTQRLPLKTNTQIIGEQRKEKEVVKLKQLKQDLTNVNLLD